MGGRMSKGGEGRSSESKEMGKARQEALHQHVRTQSNLKTLSPDVLKEIGSYVS